jgi:hypothetical protein
MRSTFVFSFVLLSGFSVALAQTDAGQKTVKDTIMRMEQD